MEQGWSDPKPEVFIATFHERDLYLRRDPVSQYAAFQWPHRKGIYHAGEFPVAVARKGYAGRGYECCISASSKHGLTSYLLQRLPNIRARGDAGYRRMKALFGEERLLEFHRRVDEAKTKIGLKSCGGDPDLFVQRPGKHDERFFVEIKMEYETGKRRYRDTLNRQQRIVFPLIEQTLGCRVRLARVIVTE